ncbi:MAG: hypothetical protein AAF992_20990 [Bacteroidota bacterium]
MKRSVYSSLSALSPHSTLSGYQLVLVLLFTLSLARATDNTVHGQSFSWSLYAKNKNNSTVTSVASNDAYVLASYNGTATYSTYTSNSLNSSLDIPSSLELSIYPSPYFDQTTMSFIAPEDGVAHLAIFNITGALVKEVFLGEVKAGQSYRFTADAADFKGSLYISKLTMGEQSSHKRLLLKR